MLRWTCQGKIELLMPYSMCVEDDVIDAAQAQLLVRARAPARAPAACALALDFAFCVIWVGACRGMSAENV